MGALKLTGKNPETHKRLLHMMMFIFISNFVIFIFKKIVVSWGTFFGRPVCDESQQKVWSLCPSLKMLRRVFNKLSSDQAFEN